MVFSSQLFLFVFLPITLLVYFVLNKKLKNIWLLIVSLIFYSWGEPKHIFLMIGSVVVNFFIGLYIENAGRIKRNLLMITACVFNLGMLGVFKYAGFFVENINAVSDLGLTVPEIALPIGISFYTFQILSYVIDVYRGGIKAQKNILNLGLYISMFPQLIAGPIVRYSDIEEQISNRTCTFEKMHSGIIRFAEGFIKKVLVADLAGSLADVMFGSDSLSTGFAWLGIIAYTIQIYFDFSGYSDMAIGLGKMLGFEFMENFNYPYISKSVREFWRRWHISLSTWFKDYVYIPLGGNRKGTARTYINITIVFFLTGFWHGASWNFVVWGIYYGIFLIAERAFLGKLISKLPSFISRIYTLAVVIIGWVFFRADNLSHAIWYIKSMFVNTSSAYEIIPQLYTSSICAVIAGIIFSLPLVRMIKNKFEDREWFIYVYDITVFMFFALSIINLVGSNFSAFLYFRF